MTRSTKVGKAQHLNAAFALLQRQVALPEAVQRLARKFELSERQAYRYLQEASHLVRPVEVTEATVPVTLKLPPRTVEMLRKHARSSGMTMGAIVTGALNAFLSALKKHG
jgi:predicted DNA-binding transcriptional regulator YafY